MNIHRIKISRTFAGVRVPFDYLYLVEYANLEVIERLFKFSIVMPLRGRMLQELQELSISQLSRNQHERTEHPTVKGFDAKLKTHLDFENRWLSVVPLLPKMPRVAALGTPGHPTYLTAKRWGFKPRGKRYSRIATTEMVAPAYQAFDDQAYLQTPGKKIRPPCLMCPRMILQQAGQCQLGDPICFEELPIGVVQAFTQDEETETVTEVASE